MPITRSASGSVARRVALASLAKSPAKRSAPANDARVSPKKPRVAVGPAASAANATRSTQDVITPNGGIGSVVPPVLSFSFEDAKRHLISVDERFQDLFDNLPCKPFEVLEPVDPFRALTRSILAQQISWFAARSVIHKFKRLYDSSIPESWKEYQDTKSTSFFPTPEQVNGSDVATLRTAGLSQRKAEYVKDLAERFVDGRLSAEKLIVASDEELAELLIAVRGIGRWTVDMFAIFSLRRANILPVGDIGVQRGLLRFVLSLHSPAHPFRISTDKIEARKGPDAGLESQHEENPLLPPQKGPSVSGNGAPPPLPAGLNVTVLKSRLDGKKVKGAFLTSQEMEALTEHWRPYRSVGVYYMWSLEEVK